MLVEKGYVSNTQKDVFGASFELGICKPGTNAVLIISPKTYSNSYLLLG